MREFLLKMAEAGADKLCDLPRYTPGAGPAPKIIAHRGAWDTSSCPENTMAAFAKAKACGVWGIEFDLRFTKDLVPVVNHDADLARIFRQPCRIESLSLTELREACPAVPRLAEVLALTGLHFMIEIKTTMGKRHLQVLAETLGGKTPGGDYHLLALEPALVREHEATPAGAWLLVGELNLRSRIELSLKNGYAGVAGHYLGLSRDAIERLHARGQAAGTGFIPSKNLLNREWSRGVDYAFTNSTSRLF